MRPTSLLGGRYELGDVIGRGGMAVVHAGRDLRSGRRVAIKALHRHLAKDPLFRSRFRREAQTMVGLCHPAIVCIFDTGTDVIEDGSHATVRVPFIVMEHVDGQTLRDVLRVGQLTLASAVQYQLGVLSALEFSHSAGVVHCDIKPANVMITSEGTVKLVDFGIARASGDLASVITQAQAVLGTPSYLSPEQALGETADISSDIYSAGCLLYELLTGRPPFVGDPISVAYQHVHEQPAPASTDVARLDAVLATALAKSRTDRFRSARAFSEALGSAAEGIVRGPRTAPAMSGHAEVAAVDC
ncbi:protein kinase [Aeromicrobium sp. SMF47]|uniref:protein kinase domain-containing protein n=1 Tax=Aeromicrobium yanjiei TaxID=2662028 RepID=UPI00129EB95E|nr:protein kinase [Aeromicrobium yanjiei]MRJ77541.1 protein kinase [Aeromicrobium yanjiei]